MKTASAPTSKHSRITLPLLVILFLFSYTVLISAVITQGKTIQSQRSLIHLLFKDNVHLSALRKGPAGQRTGAYDGAHNPAQSSQKDAAQNPSAQVLLNQVPSAQLPLTQVPSAQVPSSKVGPQANTKTDRRTHKAAKPLPAKPPAELTDPSDMRRVAFSI